MVRRCGTCGNYFESRDGFCTFCGASNLLPGERVRIPKRPKKKVKRKKKSPWKFIFLFLALFLVVYFIFIRPAVNPKYGNKSNVEISGDLIPGFYNVVGKTKSPIEKKNRTNTGESRKITYRNVDANNLSKYGDTLRAYKYYPVNLGDSRVSNGPSLSYVKASSVDKNQVLIVTGSCQDSTCTIVYEKKNGRVDEYSVGNTEQVGNSKVGFINIPIDWVQTRKGNPLEYMSPKKIAIVQLSYTRTAQTRNYENYINNVIVGIKKQQQKRQISNYGTVAISYGDNPGTLIFYKDNRDNSYVRMYYIFMEEELSVRRIVIRSLDENTKFLELAFSYTDSLSNTKNNKIAISS